MSFFYLTAFLPLIIGLLLLAFRREIIAQEYGGSALAAFGLAGLFHLMALWGATGDYETWSGQITRAVHYPRWVEEYTVTVTDYDSKGKATGSHTEYRYTTHSEHWEAETSVQADHTIDTAFFQEISRKFSNLTTEQPYKSGFYSGDRNIYVAYNKTGFVYPVTTWKRFENRIKAVPNLFQFAKVPVGMAVQPYPTNENWLESNRLIGNVHVDKREFDLMNSRLGPTKRVNVILVAMPGDIQNAQWLQAAWVGGRKNDLVLCFDSTNAISGWAYAFGWTESELVKRNLESIALNNGINTSTLPLIEEEIQQNFKPKDWHKFDYITIPPPTWALIWFPVCLLLTQGVYWYWAVNNEYTK